MLILQHNELVFYNFGEIHTKYPRIVVGAMYIMNLSPIYHLKKNCIDRIRYLYSEFVIWPAVISALLNPKGAVISVPTNH